MEEQMTDMRAKDELSGQAARILRAVMAETDPPLTEGALAKTMGVSRLAVHRMRVGGNVTMDTFQKYVTAAGGSAMLVQLNADRTVKPPPELAQVEHAVTSFRGGL